MSSLLYHKPTRQRANKATSQQANEPTSQQARRRTPRANSTRSVSRSTSQPFRAHTETEISVAYTSTESQLAGDLRKTQHHMEEQRLKDRGKQLREMEQEALDN